MARDFKRWQSAYLSTALGVFLLGNPALAQLQVRRVPMEYDKAATERGKAAFVAACSFCHGSDIRGGDGGPELLHSLIILGDENGKELGEFLRAGRPDKGMPSFNGLTADQAKDIATFLHATIYSAVTNRKVEVNIVTGSADAGKAYFNGQGKCSTCHSVTGDLQGVGAKYDPIALQDRVAIPRTGPMYGGTGKSAPVATVTLPSGQVARGTIVRMNLFHITIRDEKNVRRTFARDGDVPKIEVHDPLQGHIDNMKTMSDKQLHDLTAYLVTLK